MKILIVEDDPIFLQAVKALLLGKHTVVSARSVSEARNYLENNQPELVFCDLHLPDGLGTDLLHLIVGIKVIISSDARDSHIERAYELGCQHVFTKRNFHQTIPQFLRQLEMEEGLDKIVSELYPTHSTPLKNALHGLFRFPLKEKGVYLHGETGVGKSLLGKVIHRCLYPDTAPFVHLNCSEISESLIESELFGHVSGAFTGAVQSKVGKLKLANGGTLFLDEIGTMSLLMQQKLLKAIEEKSFFPVGSNQLEKVNFTLITASCDDLAEKIKKGEFREDFFYRFASHRLEIPPLRNRPEDITLLLNLFLEENERKIVIKPEALDVLLTYPWPGNIRELKTIATRLIHQSNGVVNAEDVKSLFHTNFQVQSSSLLLVSEQKEFILKHGLRDFIDAIESEMVDLAMEKYHGKITDCIKALKISSSAFYRILNQQ